MGSDRRKLALYLLGCFLLGAVGIAAGMHIAGTVFIDNGVTVAAPDGPAVTVDGQTDILLENPFPDANTVTIETEAGNATFSSTGASSLTVHKAELVGAWTNVTSVRANNAITIDPADKPQTTVADNIETFSYQGAYAEGDGSADFVYSAASGSSSVTIPGDASNQQLLAVDADTGDILDAADSDSSGTVTFDSLSSGTHTVAIQAGSANAPTLSNPSPTGGLQTPPSTISIDVNDSEFGEGDSVTVNITLDGTQIHSETITSAGTVSTSIPSSGQTAGQHDWSVTATDSFTQQATDSYSYSVPDTLYIRHERNHSKLVTSPVTINGTFFADDQIFTRDNVTDGTIDQTNLPVNQDFVVEATPSKANYTQRATYIQTIFEQQSLYLLNTSAVTTIEARFVLDDPTGVYSQQSVLFIQRPINTSNQTVWRTVHGDIFGAEGVTATLEEGQRYRIKILNQEGQSQIIGPYRADVSETVTVVPGTPTIGLGEFNDGWAANAGIDNTTLQYRYSDPANETDRLKVWIHEQGNESNRPVANTTYFDLGNASAVHSLTPDESKKTWKVNFIIDRNGEESTHSITVSNRRSLFGSIPSTWRMIIGIGSLFMFAGAFSILNARIGAIVVALVGGLWYWIGLLEGATMGIAVVLAVFLAALNWMRTGGGP